MLDKGSYLTDEIWVHVPHQIGSVVSLNSGFKQGLTLLKLMRRFGCPLTRQECLDISKYKYDFDKLKVSVVGIGFDVAGVNEFSIGGYWKGELYVDPYRDIYRLLNINRGTKFMAIKNFLNWEFRKAFNNQKNELHGNMKGDAMQLGATVLIDRDGQILYSLVQADFQDTPNLGEILAICRHKALFANLPPNTVPVPLGSNRMLNHRSESLKAKKNPSSILTDPKKTRSLRKASIDKKNVRWEMNSVATFPSQPFN